MGSLTSGSQIRAPFTRVLPLLAVALCLIGARPGRAAIIYVQTAGADYQNGTTWLTAKGTIGGALSAAKAGDQIWVAAGVYTEKITLVNGAALYGGFTGSETALAQRDWTAHRCVIDGNGSGTVVTASGVNAATRLDGFTVRNGDNSGINCLNSAVLTIADCAIVSNSASDGAGIYCDSSSPVITGNQIAQNSTGSYGGGIYCHNGSPVITRNTISSNVAGNGGAIFSGSNSSPTIASNIILNNSASYGAGIYAGGTSPAIRSNVIKGNNARTQGGGIYCSASGTVIRSNFVLWNNASDGGGMYVDSSSPRVTNNTFVGNSATSQTSGGAITLYTPTYDTATTPVIGNNIIALNSSGILAGEAGKCAPAFSHNCFSGNNFFHHSGVSWASTDIFISPGLLNTVLGDYHLAAGSACIDAGDDTLAGSGTLDVDGDARLVGAHVDIGADEYTTPRTPAATRTVLYVTTTGADSSAGTDWTIAKQTIGGALAAAHPGDSLWVAAGNYPSRISLAPGVAIFGGFGGSETAVEQRNAGLNVTVLDGGGSNTVVTASDVGPTSVLSDVTVQNGSPGIDCEHASPVLMHDIISGNTASRGGGVYVNTADPILTADYIQNNNADYGGGLYITNSPGSVVQFCVIRNNTATYGGGGVCCIGSAAIIGNVITGNNSDTGGALYFQDGVGTLASNMIGANSANHAAGLFLYGSNLRIVNNTIVNNVAAQASNAGGIAMQSDNNTPSSPLIVNNIIAFNTGYGVLRMDTSCAPQRGSNCFAQNTDSNYAGMSGALTDNYADPHLVDLTGGDYHLAPGSPCIDAGNDTFVNPGDQDVNDRPRIAGSHVDIGADEFIVKRGPATLYWQNGATGDFNFWAMSGASIAGSGKMTNLPDKNWKVGATADLFGTGHTDMILQNRSSGEIVYWDIAAGAIVSSGYISTLTDMNWSIVGSADLFHTGRTDLLWQNTATGDVVYWELSNGALVGNGYIKTLPDLNWRIAATADLFGTGRTDLIWQNTANGDVVYWDLNGAAIAGAGYIRTVPDRNYKIVGATDLSRDGRVDLIWQNNSSGDVVYWQMTGTAITGSGSITTQPNLNWKIVGAR